jgi:hypothetical protein
MTDLAHVPGVEATILLAQMSCRMVTAVSTCEKKRGRDEKVRKS